MENNNVLENNNCNCNILQYKDCVPTSEIAKDYGMTTKGFNILLNKLEIQYKQNGEYKLYDEFQGKGYTQTKLSTHSIKIGCITTTVTLKQLLWTQQGRWFLHKFLRQNGIEQLKYIRRK
jgi:hypothetical protein plarl_12311